MPKPMRSAAVAIALASACGGGRAPPPKPPSVDVRAEIEQAETAERARRHDVARAHYERAVAAAKDPASIAFARREYAETLITWGEYPAAIAQLEGALAAAPGDAKSWHDLGHLRFNKGDGPGAIDAFGRSIKLAPADYRPRRSLAVAQWKTGDLAGASATYKAMLALELPERLRASVEWAVSAIAAIQRGDKPPPPPRSADPRT